MVLGFLLLRVWCVVCSVCLLKFLLLLPETLNKNLEHNKEFAEQGIVVAEQEITFAEQGIRLLSKFFGLFKIPVR